MTKQQLSKLQSLTHQLAQYERMVFRITEVDNTIVFAAFDTHGRKWFEDEHSLYGYVGPRGGFRKYDGTLAV